MEIEDKIPADFYDQFMKAADAYTKRLFPPAPTPSELACGMHPVAIQGMGLLMAGVKICKGLVISKEQLLEDVAHIYDAVTIQQTLTEKVLQEIKNIEAENAKPEPTRH